MVVAALGSLAYKLKATGFGKFASKMGDAQKSFGGMKDKMGKGLEGLKKGWMAMGAVSLGMLAKMTQASPRLRAQMTMINVQANKIFRVFGDELAPVFKIVADALKSLISWFQGLPEPVQKAIAIGGAVVVILGILTIAFIALNAAMSPITLIILGIGAAAALLYLAFESNFMGIRDIAMAVFDYLTFSFKVLIDLIEWFVNDIIPLIPGALEDAGEFIMKIIDSIVGTFTGFFDNIVGIFDGIVNFIDSIFKGDLEGAFNAIIDIVTGIFQTFVDIIAWPLIAMNNLIKDLFGTDIMAQLQQAGAALFDAIIAGLTQAVQEAAGIVGDLLSWFAGWFGGSLPDKGPLQKIDLMGEELGTAYVEGVSSGIQSFSTTRKLEKHLHIGTVEIKAMSQDLTSTQMFGRRLEQTAVRRGTSW